MSAWQRNITKVQQRVLFFIFFIILGGGGAGGKVGGNRLHLQTTFSR